MTGQTDTLDIIRQYHEISKHRPDKYADGPDALDWDLQPDPFRVYEGSDKIRLPLSARTLEYSLSDLITPGQIESRLFSSDTLGQLLETSLALSAWKTFGSDRWSLRCNPSSGNLHPTEAYLVCDNIDEIHNGVYHYHSYEHSLESRCTLPENRQILPDNCLVIGLSSIHWRESWKYGIRAYRYCQLDIGHAIAAVRYAAALQGWHVHVLDHASDDQISRLLGVDRMDDFLESEAETADILLLVSRHDDFDIATLDLEWLATIAHSSPWHGMANILSPQGRIDWPAIEKVSKACTRPVSEFTRIPPATGRYIEYADKHLNASQIIRQRRSAQAFDGQSMLSPEHFIHMLASLVPEIQSMPFDCGNETAHIHLVFYIHRVQDLPAGLYVLPRNATGIDMLKGHFRDEFEWQKPELCPEELPFYRLVKANCRNAARSVSCHQDIASDGAFAVSMLAEFDSVLKDTPWKYRDLYHEAGMVGQVLYIEAEAAGIRGTGIGCFFDDSIHEILGLQDHTLQCLYNFTVGTPVMDTRLVSLPPYSHLQDRKA